MSYNLWDEPWIPCRDLAGCAVTVGLRDLFAQAESLRPYLDVGSPFAQVGVLRLALAITHRAVQGPDTWEAWQEIWAAGRISPEAIRAYEAQWYSRFDLCDPTRPFFQVGGLELASATGKLRPVVALADRAVGTHHAWFDHLDDRDPQALAPGQVALALVGYQAVCPPGGNGTKTNVWGRTPSWSGAPLAARPCVYLLGRTLGETLRLNLLATEALPEWLAGGEDCPIWERDSVTTIMPGRRPPDGLTDYYTWQTRAIRVLWDEDGLARRMVHVHWQTWPDELRRVEQPYAGTGKSQDQIKLRAWRSVWRDGVAVFGLGWIGEGKVRPPLVVAQAQRLVGLGALSREHVFRLLVAGRVSGSKPAKTSAAIWATYALPGVIIADPSRGRELSAAIRISETVATQLGRVVWGTYGAARFGTAHRDKARRDVVQRECVRVYWDLVVEDYRRLEDRLCSSDHPEQAYTRWYTNLWTAAVRAYDSVAAGDLRRLEAAQAYTTARRKLTAALMQIEPIATATQRKAAGNKKELNDGNQDHDDEGSPQTGVEAARAARSAGDPGRDPSVRRTSADATAPE